MDRSHALLLLMLLACGCLRPAGIRYPNLPPYQAGALHIVNFDVGQAESLLVIYAGKTLMIDCGSPISNPRKAMHAIPRRLDALLGSRHLDYFLVSHFHQDHVGAPGNQPNRRDPMGLYALIERDGLTIGTLLDRGFWSIGEPGATQRHFESASKAWVKSGVVGRHVVVKPGDHIDMGEGLDVEVITAAGNGLLGRLRSLFPTFVAGAPPSENDYSVGVKITLGDFEMFSAGDLSGRNVVRQHGPHREAYTDIESRVAKTIGAIEVYRVDHHGSRHSTNPCFAQTLRPQVSVFSTGYNHYGHPSPRVYNTLESYGDVYITGGIDPFREGEIDPEDIVGDDVEILVAPDGKTFWANGKEYESLSDAEELARPVGPVDHCAGPDQVRPEQYDVEIDEKAYGD